MGTAAVVLFLVIWEAVADARIVSALFLPGPLDIYKALAGYVQEGAFWQDLWTSGLELIIGFCMAIAIGLPLGLLIGWYTRVRYVLDPFVAFFYATPRIALVPLFLIWFGIGIWSKIAVIFLGAVFPIIINTMAGVRNLDPSLIKAARSFGAGDFQLFRTVALPGAVPFILTGMRLGVGHALIGVVVGEFVAAEAGVGKMMADAANTFQTPRVFAGLLIVAGTGLLLTSLLQRLEESFQNWRPKQ